MAPSTPSPSGSAPPGGHPGTDSDPGPGPDRGLPRRAVSRVVSRLQSGYQRDDAWAVATVARLRREAGREAHTSAGAWGLVHMETLAELREQRREEEHEARGARADPADLSSTGWADREARELREDTAVHLAVTLWALHQQSLRDEPMHGPGWTLGRAVRRLAHGRTGTRDEPRPRAAEDGAPDSTVEPKDRPPVEEVSESVRRRFVRVGGASDTEMLAARLRDLVLLLRAARIPLDYALLADQLARWQQEDRRDGVRRIWGRDFHRHYPSAEGGSRGGGTGGEPGAGAAPPTDDTVIPEDEDADA
ncbi:type I-E CRISPR-associated protein Cse2/CasB [Streptomyces sp. SHP 1-2]|uniref:type I-E CRISPR-associated protein Cse2/CasB n=1 Tax=Streptomyces sp. SHP 1-2 TaxID=2769489 RepID=UPI002237E90B|nr:type I-E CRISPR-associated protein Cse2/CasB [Streptomyces sp. SHP 1-2]MCW5250144.1 type I-E CRISPR-associated protein Cse2/CasB [Streptomyces sp. SHP 1-2]